MSIATEDIRRRAIDAYQKGRGTQAQWMVFWHQFVISSIVISAFTTVWLLVGGMRDLKDMLYDLKNMSRSSHDDGFVVHGHNADEEDVDE